MPIIRRLREIGAKQVIYCPKEEGHTEILKAEGFYLRLGDVSSYLSLRIPIDLIKLIYYLRKERFDILIAHQPMGALIGIPAAVLARIPHRIYSTGGLKFYPGKMSFSNLIMKNSERVIIGLSSEVFLVNLEDEQTLVDMSLESKARYVGPRGGCGINTKMFNSSRRETMRRKVRAELGISENIFVIGFSGRCVWEKGFREMIEAATHIRYTDNSDALFLIVGGDDHRMQRVDIEEEVMKCGVEEHFRFLGYRFNIDYYMSAFDIFILPSYREGFPVSLLEAMAMGIPCIATEIRGSRELIEDGVTGLLIPVHNSIALSKAITYLFENVEHRCAIAKNASEHVAKTYNETILVNRTISYLEGLIQKLA